MYATVVQYDMRATGSSLERGRLGRILATRLSTLPGFVAFVALDFDADTEQVATLCIFEDPAGLIAADHVVEQWQADHSPSVGAGIERIGSGVVIVQKGL